MDAGITPPRFRTFRRHMHLEFLPSQCSDILPSGLQKWPPKWVPNGSKTTPLQCLRKLLPKLPVSSFSNHVLRIDDVPQTQQIVCRNHISTCRKCSQQKTSNLPKSTQKNTKKRCTMRPRNATPSEAQKNVKKRSTKPFKTLPNLPPKVRGLPSFPASSPHINRQSAIQLST